MRMTTGSHGAHVYTSAENAFPPAHAHIQTRMYTQASTAIGFPADVVAFSYFGSPIERDKSGDTSQIHACTFTRWPIGSLFFMAN